MCGISAIISYDYKKEIPYILKDSLFNIQHRGQDSYGMILVSNHGNLDIIHEKGLVNNLDINKRLFNNYNIGIGHVRYPTKGDNSLKNAQPFYKYCKNTHILAHNGQVSLKSNVKNMNILNKIKDKSISDSMILLELLSAEFINIDTNVSNEKIINGFNNISHYLDGTYSCIYHILNVGTFIFKDKYGVKPLVIGHNNSQYLVSSESISLKNLGYKIVGDIKPGEVIFFPTNDISNIRRIKYNNENLCCPCIFEWIYFAGVGSSIYNVSVYQSRLKMGEYLAEKIKRRFINNKWDLSSIDFVVPVPETSKPGALRVSEVLGIPYREAIIKSRYINRTFIMDTQEKRLYNLKYKFNILEEIIKGKNIIVVDDSIVRGNTLKTLIGKLKSVGVGNIIICSCAPEIRHINKYGIDIQDEKLLIARGRSNKEITEYLGATDVIYQDLEDVVKSISDLNPKLTNFELSVFDNKYL